MSTEREAEFAEIEREVLARWAALARILEDIGEAGSDVHQGDR